MDIPQLEAFERIVREGSFSRAAQELEISQPTISARIRTLEEEIGGPLFVRGGRTLTLTVRGESFLPYARRALSVLREGQEAAREAEQGQRGRVTIAAIESLGGVLARVVTRFHTLYPQVEIFVRAQHTDQIVQLVQDGVVKLGLMTWPYAGFGVELVPLVRVREPLLLVATPRHPLLRRPALTLAEAVAEGSPFLQVRWGPPTRRLFEQVATLNGPQVEVPIDTAHRMVLQGVGVAYLTKTLVADDLAAGRLVTLTVADQPPLHREIALVHLPRAELSIAVQRFAAELQAALQ